MMKLFDLKPKVNLSKIKNNFDLLKADPLLGNKQYKNISRFVVKKNGLLFKRPHISLYDNDKYIKLYQEYQPCDEAIKVLQEFVQLAPIRDGKELLVQAKRVRVPGLIGINYEQRQLIDLVGIFFISGGSQEGQLAIFDKQSVQSNFLKHFCKNHETIERDLIIMSSPSHILLL